MCSMRRALALNLGTALDLFPLGKFLTSSVFQGQPGHH